MADKTDMFDDTIENTEAKAQNAGVDATQGAEQVPDGVPSPDAWDNGGDLDGVTLHISRTYARPLSLNIGYHAYSCTQTICP